MNHSIKINLQKLHNAALLIIPGRTAKKRCICIPVDDNPEIFVGEKGIYLNLTAIEMKELSQYGDTHLIKGNIPDDAYRVMTEEEGAADTRADASYCKEGAACSGSAGGSGR